PARHAPVALARAHVGEHDEIEAGGLDRAFLERAHDLVVAARDRELELSRHRQSLLSVPPQIEAPPLIPAKAGIQEQLGPRNGVPGPGPAGGALWGDEQT